LTLRGQWDALSNQTRPVFRTDLGWLVDDRSRVVNIQTAQTRTGPMGWE